jgi:hypothetical protein
MKILNILLILTLTIFSCKSKEPVQPKFEHDVLSGPKPWTGEKFELEEDDFTFAIISDLTGGEREGVLVLLLNKLID